MKYFSHILLLLLIFLSCKKEVFDVNKTTLKHSTVDSLSSNKEVEKFIKLKDTAFNGFKLWMSKDYQYLKNNISKNSIKSSTLYSKADFDNNGFQDLFVTGDFYNDNLEQSFVIMNFGKDSIKTIWVGNYTMNPIILIRENNHNYLEIQSGNQKQRLIYNYGAFINLNNSPSHFKIEKIEFESIDIRGKWTIILDADLNVSIQHEIGYYKKIILKESKKKLSQQQFDEIYNLLNYMDFSTLPEKYFKQGSDRPMCEIKVFYNGGLVKKIFDYGRRGNYSLKNLYKKIESLKD